MSDKIKQVPSEITPPAIENALNCAELKSALAGLKAFGGISNKINLKETP